MTDTEVQRLKDAAGLDLVTLLVDASFALERYIPGSVLTGALDRAAAKLREAWKTDEWHRQREAHARYVREMMR